MYCTPRARTVRLKEKKRWSCGKMNPLRVTCSYVCFMLDVLLLSRMIIILTKSVSIVAVVVVRQKHR